MKLGRFMEMALLLVLIAVPVVAAEDAGVIWYVAPEMAPCSDSSADMCLQVKESGQENYTAFSGIIDGFCYGPGFEYVIKVMKEPASADTSSNNWTLLEMISKTGALTSSNLEGVTWSLDSRLDQEGKKVCLLPYTEITASFDSGMISGYGGCNNYRGSYTADGENITFSGILSTMMFCPDGISNQESEYLANLQNATSYNISGNLLRMMDVDGKVLLTYSVVQPLPLVSTNWSMLNYNNGLGLFSALAGTEVTALFGVDGNLTGSAGCNNYRSSYQVEGNNITIGPAATILMSCSEPEGIMEQESDYLAALESASSYRIERQQLMLFFANESTAAIFENAPAI
jgi:heat shock protein HslJ